MHTACKNRARVLDGQHVHRAVLLEERDGRCGHAEALHVSELLRQRHERLLNVAIELVGLVEPDLEDDLAEHDVQAGVVVYAPYQPRDIRNARPVRSLLEDGCVRSRDRLPRRSLCILSKKSFTQVTPRSCLMVF